MCATWDWLLSSLDMMWTFSSFQCTLAKGCKQKWFVELPPPRPLLTLAGPQLTTGSFVSQVSITCGSLQDWAPVASPQTSSRIGSQDSCVPGSFLLLRSQLRKNQRADGTWEGLILLLSRPRFLLSWFPFLSDLRVFTLSSHSWMNAISQQLPGLKSSVCLENV